MQRPQHRQGITGRARGPRHFHSPGDASPAAAAARSSGRMHPVMTAGRTGKAAKLPHRERIGRRRSYQELRSRRPSDPRHAAATDIASSAASRSPPPRTACAAASESGTSTRDTLHPAHNARRGRTRPVTPPGPTSIPLSTPLTGPAGGPSSTSIAVSASITASAKDEPGGACASKGRCPVRWRDIASAEAVPIPSCPP